MVRESKQRLSCIRTRNECNLWLTHYACVLMSEMSMPFLPLEKIRCLKRTNTNAAAATARITTMEIPAEWVVI